MNEILPDDAYSVEHYPRIRHATRDLLNAAARKHMIHAMVEVDVTDARSALRHIGRETGETPSFTGLVIACCARAVARNPRVHAYRTIRNRLVLFNDVDVSVTVERVVDGQSQVVPTIVRAANRKSVREIHDEIRSAQTTPVERAGVFSSIRVYLMIPPLVRRLVFRLLDRMPRLMKERAGTIMVTSVGMFGGGAGWGIPIASHTLNVTVGGVVQRPRLVDGEMAERDNLCLTISFDHDIVDGAPAARFLSRLRRELERGAKIAGGEG